MLRSICMKTYFDKKTIRQKVIGTTLKMELLKLTIIQDAVRR